VSQNGGEEVVPIEEAVVLLKEAEEDRTEADKKLKGILEKMGLA
jgi:type I restriction enzyme M protein